MPVRTRGFPYGNRERRNDDATDESLHHSMPLKHAEQTMPEREKFEVLPGSKLIARAREPDVDQLNDVSWIGAEHDD